jgi:hypothetical protein
MTSVACEIQNRKDIEMRLSAVIVVTILIPGICFGGEVEKLYYLGEFKLSDPSGKPYVSQVILMEKTLDPDHSVWVERAIVVKPDGKAEEFAMNHIVTGNTFTLDDPKGTVKGSGTVFGPPWKWTYFKGIFDATNGVRIEDENFMADPSVLVARKKLTGPDGKVIGFMDGTAKSITPQTFMILSSSLLKKGSESKREKQPEVPRRTNG